MRPREYDGSHISFVGMSPEITLRKHQRDAIARILYGGNTLLGHVAGGRENVDVPDNPNENLQKMTIRHLLCTGGGMETTCKMDEN